MQMVSVDIMHPPMDLENTSPLDPETDPPPLDPETDPPPLDLKTDPCPEASHSPALSDLHADQPQAFQTSHPPAQSSHPLAQSSHPPTQSSHPPAHSFLANQPPIGFTFTEDVKTKSSSDIPTKVGSLRLYQNSCIFLD